MSRQLVMLRQHVAPPVVVRVEAIELLLRLEGAGFQFRPDGEGHLLVSPASRLGEADRDALREYQEDCLLVVTLDPPRL